MSQPTAFENLRNRKTEEQKAATERSNRVHKEREAEEEVLFEKIRKALKPYSDCTLTDDYGTKRRVYVVDNAHERKVDVFFDGHRFLTFRPERHFSSCHCKGPCEHEYNTWLTLDVTQHQKRKGYEDYGCWFGVGTNEIEDENAWAESINRMLTDFRSSGWVKI